MNISIFVRHIKPSNFKLALMCFIYLFDKGENECASNPCKNQATCIDGLKKYTCRCADEYTGQTCDRRKPYFSFSREMQMLI